MPFFYLWIWTFIVSQLSLTPARKAMVIAGALVVAATWIYLVLLRPTDWHSVAGSTEALVTLSGYLIGAALLLAGTVPALPARTCLLYTSDAADDLLTV